MFLEQTHIPYQEQEPQLVISELTTLEELTQFWLSFRRNNGLSAPKPKTEQLLASAEARATLRDLAEDKPIHLYGAVDGDRIIGTGKLEVWTDEDEIKRGYLSHLTVDEEYRGKHVAKQITDRRIDAARELGCKFVDTKVFTENPIALVTKLNDGFFIRDIEFGENTAEWGAFVLSKPITEESPYDTDTSRSELRDVALTELETLEQMFETDWIGIDMKNLGDAKDNNPANWHMILEKRNV